MQSNAVPTSCKNTTEKQSKYHFLQLMASQVGGTYKTVISLMVRVRRKGITINSKALLMHRF